MKDKVFNIDEEFRMKVVNFLKIYGDYEGVLVKDGNDKKYANGLVTIDNVILNKRDFLELKAGVNNVLDCCYENGYNAIENIMKYFYKVECKTVREKYGSFFDRH